MTECEHQTLIDEVLEMARRQLKQTGMLVFTVLTVNEAGEKACEEIDPAFFQNDKNKNGLARKLRRDFRRKGIVRYILVTEGWHTHMPAMPGVPMRRENIDRYHAAYADDYERRGLSPRPGGGRDEIILMHVCDRVRSSLRMWKIKRSPFTGGVLDLVAIDTGDDTYFSGRFVNLLEGQVH
ncbi:MAG: hypothetical protein ACJ8AW_40385 [Rhodopila sp.]